VRILAGPTLSSVIASATRFRGVTRIDDAMADAIDALIASGEFASRSDVVREGVAMLSRRIGRLRAPRVRIRAALSALADC
jgi:Arc/MetJ-type ribon-helix-helix transcriptional regulator